MTLAALLLAFGGFALLAAAMPRSADRLRPGLPPRMLRIVGFGLVAVSAVIHLATMPNWRFALVEWIGSLTLAAASTALLLFLAPRFILRGVVAAGIIALLAMAMRF